MEGGLNLATGPVTLINVFTVNPQRQAELAELLAAATDEVVRFAPGFVSAQLHLSLDGTKVTMVAEWRSEREYQAMREDPRPLPYFQRALEFASFEPGMYRRAKVFAPPG